jgi:hypothetical protein
MTTGAIIYISLCVGFVSLLSIVGWLFVKYYSKKHNLK